MRTAGPRLWQPLMADGPIDTSDALDLSNAVHGLTSLLLDERPIEAKLQQVTDLALRSLPAVGVGVTLAPEGGARTVAASGCPSVEIDQLQYDLDDGPCLEGMRRDVVVVVEDMREETRWGAFPRRAADGHGLRSSLSLPLTVGGDTVGVLNCYATEPDQFDELQCRIGTVFAAQAAMVLLASLRMADQATLGEQLRTALSSRAVIDQAIGVLMAQQQCSPEQAFDLLKGASQSRNVKLRDIAQELVGRYGAPGRDGT